METFFLKSEDIRAFYDTVASRYTLLLPSKVNAPARISCPHGYALPSDDYLCRNYLELKDEEPVFNEYRCVEPVRSFFTPPVERLGTYFTGDHGTGRGDGRPLAVAGVKNCDLFSLKIQDYVFLGGEEADPFYQARRESTLIISGDCPAFKETCFCRALAIEPFAVEGFDFNLSPLTDGFLLDAATPKAQVLIESMRAELRPATIGQISGREEKRAAAARRLDEHARCHGIPPKEKLQAIVRKGLHSPVWKEQMQTCVECGGCVFMCDTCHCFLLSDEKADGVNARTRTWDGCLYPNFTRVAGGANALKLRYMRLRNRYLKKFDFFIDNLGVQACCGCGRCVDVCPGKIDIRHILHTLHEEYLSAS